MALNDPNHRTYLWVRFLCLPCIVLVIYNEQGIRYKIKQSQ